MHYLKRYCLIISSIFLLLYNPQVAFARPATNEAASSGVTESDDTSNPINSSESTSSSFNDSNSTYNIQQQADAINYSSRNSSMSHPNCRGTCIFAVGRVDNQGGTEAIAGVLWQLSSPENTLSQTQQIITQVEADNLEQESTTALAEKIAEALETGKKERATLLAIILAKRLGYTSHEHLLQDMGVLSLTD
jgi:hypothetical protein